MAKVAIDIDDTLCSFTELARGILAEWPDPDRAEQAKRAAYSPWTQWRALADLCDPWVMDLIDKCHLPESILSNEPFDGSVEVVNELADAGHEMLYISNRASERHNATLEWLLDCGFPMHGNTLCCTYEGKMSHVTDCQFMIDDRPKTLVEFVSDYRWKYEHRDEVWRESDKARTRVAFGLMTPANQSLTDVGGVYLAPTWGLLRQYLQKAGLL